MSLTALRRTAAPVAVLAATAAGLAVAPSPAPTQPTKPPARPRRCRSAPSTPPSVRAGATPSPAHLGIAGPVIAAGRTVTLEAKPMGTDSLHPGRYGDRRPTAVGCASPSRPTSPPATAGTTPATPTPGRASAASPPSASVRRSTRPTRIDTSLSIRAVHRVVKPDGSDLIRGQPAGRPRPAAAPRRDPGVAHRRQRQLDVRGRPPHPPARRRRVPGRSPPTNTAYRLVFLGYAAPAARAQRRRPDRHPARPDHRRRPDPHRPRERPRRSPASPPTTGTPIAGATVKLLARKAGTHRVHAGRPPARRPATARSRSPSPARDDGRTGCAWSTPTACARALSDAARVAVRIPTSLSIRGRATGTEFVVSGTLLGGGHPLARRAVTLQSPGIGLGRLDRGRHRTTNRHGFVKFHEPLTPGTGYRLAYAGGPRFAPSTSGTVVS